MENKHTPGPWHALNYAGYVHIQSEDGYSYSNVLDEDQDENAEANGKLAAAAPDLLEALQNIVYCFNKAEDLGHLDYLIQERKALEQAKAAISKATE